MTEQRNKDWTDSILFQYQTRTEAAVHVDIHVLRPCPTGFLHLGEFPFILKCQDILRVKFVLRNIIDKVKLYSPITKELDQQKFEHQYKQKFLCRFMSYPYYNLLNKFTGILCTDANQSVFFLICTGGHKSSKFLITVLDCSKFVVAGPTLWWI